MTIAGRAIGERHPTFVIAEAGVNHDGSVEKALRLIDAAKAACADAVKFQCFRADALVAPETPTCGYQAAHGAAATDQREMLRRLELSRSGFLHLAEYAREREILFLATPFGIDELRFLSDEVGVSAIKIASPDLVNGPLLSAACDANLPIIVSTGAADEAEIGSVVEVFRSRVSANRLVLLHCVSAYPTPLNDARLGSIRTLRDKFTVPVGFSDHTAEVETGSFAVLAGANVLEKHLTLSRSAPGPDHFFSLEPAVFAEYVLRVRHAEQILGDGKLTPAPFEREVRELARGRVIAGRSIRAGEVLTHEMIRIQRSAAGISVASLPRIIGRRFREAVPSGRPVTESMLDSNSEL